MFFTKEPKNRKDTKKGMQQATEKLASEVKQLSDEIKKAIEESQSK